MDREILFRGKSVVTDCWVYGYFVNCASMYDYPEDKVPEIIDEEADRIYRGEYNPNDVREVIPETVGQYTGIKDKNGEEIFEGDIVRAMMDYGPAGMLETVTDIHYEKYDGYRWNYFDLSTIEVIGNKWDNPELLGGLK